MRVINVVILAGWFAFGIYWIAAPAGGKARQSLRRRVSVGLQVAISFVVLVLLLRLNVFVIHNPWAKGIGLALFLLGVALAVWARVYLGLNWGTPMSRKAGQELVTTGPYRYIRHPIYSGIVLGMVGSALAVSLVWLFGAAAVGAYFGYSAVHEERFMAERFPRTYPAYKKSTKMLIPFIF